MIRWNRKVEWLVVVDPECHVRPESVVARYLKSLDNNRKAAVHPLDHIPIGVWHETFTINAAGYFHQHRPVAQTATHD